MLTPPHPDFIAGQEAFIAWELHGVLETQWDRFLDRQFWAGWEMEKLDCMEAVYA